MMRRKRILILGIDTGYWQRNNNSLCIFFSLPQLETGLTPLDPLSMPCLPPAVPPPQIMTLSAPGDLPSWSWLSLRTHNAGRKHCFPNSHFIWLNQPLNLVWFLWHSTWDFTEILWHWNISFASKKSLDLLLFWRKISVHHHLQSQLVTQATSDGDCSVLLRNCILSSKKTWGHTLLYFSEEEKLYRTFLAQ